MLNVDRSFSDLDLIYDKSKTKKKECVSLSAVPTKIFFECWMVKEEAINIHHNFTHVTCNTHTKISNTSKGVSLSISFEYEVDIIIELTAKLWVTVAHSYSMYPINNELNNINVNKYLNDWELSYFAKCWFLGTFVP